MTATHATASVSWSMNASVSGSPSDTLLSTPAPRRLAFSVLVGLALSVGPGANASTIVADVDAFRVSIITAITGIVGVPPTAVSRFILRLPDCTELALEPRLGRNAIRHVATDGGTDAVPCVPGAGHIQVLLVTDASSLGGGTSVDSAVRRVHSVFNNATAYAAAVGSLRARWDVVANVTADAASVRSIDLLYLSDTASAVAAAGGSVVSGHAGGLLGAGVALVLALALAVVSLHG